MWITQERWAEHEGVKKSAQTMGTNLIKSQETGVRGLLAILVWTGAGGSVGMDVKQQTKKLGSAGVQCACVCLNLF